MDTSEEKKEDGLSKYIVQALDIEDDMCTDVYGDFLDREKWPAAMDDESFKNVKENLEKLIEGTENHRRIISSFK